ncbi:hypothetical protein [Streptomyces sp. JJ36]|uniref:hypothetical protein n=1 Tax=Streptomyces sp. JJ36 TaxID=2736645 RepID=UPI001F3EC3A4|nr:hypothetical protein [Streptomyces sp. JJ36]MCF6525027.1 hypothetical protein [Streptomyces sp. JJ36]
MTTGWSRHAHAYGPADDVPRLLAEAGDPDPDVAEEAWEELWSSLCHQGTVYPASFLALPLLADIAASRRPGDQHQAIALAGRIVAGANRLHQSGYVRTRYPEAFGELHRAALHHLRKGRFDSEETDCLHLLQDLLAFEGVPVWDDCLLPGLHDVVCPCCSASLELDFCEEQPGTRRRDPEEQVRRLNFKGPAPAPIRPAGLSELRPPAPRLHRLAVHAGQPAAAEHLTRLFGRTTCPDCDEEFSVPPQIEAQVPEAPSTLRQQAGG